jgi:hypothetical protein
MQKRNVGIPIGTGVCAETEGMIYWETKVIGASLIHERERAIWQRVPGMGWNNIECGFQLFFKRRVLVKSSVDVEVGNRHGLVPR